MSGRLSKAQEPPVDRRRQETAVVKAVRTSSKEQERDNFCTELVEHLTDLVVVLKKIWKLVADRIRD